MKKAVRWNSSFFGVEGMGWFASMHAVTRHVKVTFMNGVVGSAAAAGGEECGGAVGEHSGERSGRGADGGLSAAVGGVAGGGGLRGRLAIHAQRLEPDCSVRLCRVRRLPSECRTNDVALSKRLATKGINRLQGCAQISRYVILPELFNDFRFRQIHLVFTLQLGN